MRQFMKTAFFLFLCLFFTVASASENTQNIKNINTLDLQQYQGQVVYLDFWASWCKPCQKSFPWMNQLVEKYADRPFKLITINLDESPQDMFLFLQKVPAHFDIYQDPQGKLAEKFELQGMPTSYLIGKDGKVFKRHVGFLTKEIDRYEQELESLL